jgi:hypothetical protein
VEWLARTQLTNVLQANVRRQHAEGVARKEQGRFRAALVRAYENGASVIELAELTGVSRQRIYDQLKA